MMPDVDHAPHVLDRESPARQSFGSSGPCDVHAEYTIDITGLPDRTDATNSDASLNDPDPVQRTLRRPTTEARAGSRWTLPHLRRATTNPQDQGDTFCRYLAKQLVAKQGFAPAPPRRPREIAAQSDYVLNSPTAMRRSSSRLIDREAHPDKAFTLSAGRVREIAEDCRLAAGPRRPIDEQCAINDPSDGGRRRHAPIKRRGSARSSRASWTTSSRPGRSIRNAPTIWTTAGWRGRDLRKFIQQSARRAARGRCRRRPVAVAPRSFPWLTAAIDRRAGRDLRRRDRVRRRRNRQARSSRLSRRWSRSAG